MPPLDWQLFAVLACIAGAVFVVARRIRRIVRPVAPGQHAGTCGSCGSCGTAPTPADARERNSFVPIQSLTKATFAKKRST